MTEDDGIHAWNVAKLLSLDKLNTIRFRTFNCYDVVNFYTVFELETQNSKRNQF